MESIQIDKGKKDEREVIIKREERKDYKIYAFLTNPTIVRKAGLIGVVGFFSFLIAAMMVAAIVNPNFNVVTFMISALGGRSTTVAPFLLDTAFLIMSIGVTPALFYLDKVLAPYPQNNDDLIKTSRFRSRLGSYGTLFMLIGLIGLCGVGIFSVDRSPIVSFTYLYEEGDGVGLHIIMSYLCFVGCTFGGIFFGIIIVRYKTIIPKALGYYMILVPIIPFLILIIPPRLDYSEWFLLLSYSGWIIPGALILGKHLKEERKSM